jgi:CubicO group peptidase (beta-lactamase class C family)
MPMTRLLLAGFAALLAASAIARAGAPGYTAAEASRLRRAVTLENWDDGGDVSRFVYLNMSQIFPAAVVRRAGPVVPLPLALNPAIGRYVVDTKDDRPITLQQFVAEGPLDGFLVVHRGRVAYEQYPRMRPDDKHMAFSVTKAFVGMAVALLEDRGQVHIDRPIGEAIHELQGTAWDKAKIRDVLEMASGMEAAETGEAYGNPRHKHYQYEASLGWLPQTAEMSPAVQRAETYAYLATLGRVREPGTAWEYASVNTAVLGWLVERVSGKTVSTFLADEFWSRMGAEADALMAVNRNGIAVSHGGLAMTLRDLARFGMLFTRPPSPPKGDPVIPGRILRRITTGGRTQLVDPPKGPSSRTHVAYQWDGVTAQGDFYKGGFGGQLLYVAPRKDVVIAHFGTNATLDSPPPRLLLSKMIDDLF